MNCCCGLHWRVSGSHSVSNGKTGIDLITLIRNSRNVESLLAHQKPQATGATMKVMHKINMLGVGSQRLFTSQTLGDACGSIFANFHSQRSKSRAILSVTDSLYVAPINSYFLTCVERRNSPPHTIVGAGRLTGLHLLSSGFLLPESQPPTEFTKVRRSTERPNRGETCDFLIKEETAKRRKGGKPEEA